MAKQWDCDGVPLAESNCAGIGSDEDIASRKVAAEAEPAWAGAGAEPGMWIWRIENFGVKPWPKEYYGRFYKGDSYIVLHTTAKDSGALVHDIYFWLGQETSIDERGTAAYKTVELDDLLDGLPTQHREVMQRESAQFLGLFDDGIEYMDGGIESAFNQAHPEVYQTKLMQVKKINPTDDPSLVKPVIRITEVPCTRKSLNHSDCFILDAGEHIYNWFGDSCSPFEKAAANFQAERLEGQRHGKAKATHDIDAAFWEKLGGEGYISKMDSVLRTRSSVWGEGILYKLSDTTGNLTCSEVARRDLHRDMLSTDDVMMLDEGVEIFLWIGKGASPLEKRNALRTAMTYLKANGKDSETPIHILKEGVPIQNRIFNKIFAD